MFACVNNLNSLKKCHWLILFNIIKIKKTIIFIVIKNINFIIKLLIIILIDIDIDKMFYNIINIDTNIKRSK